MILIILAVACGLIATISAIMLYQKKILITNRIRLEQLMASMIALCILLSIMAGTLFFSSNECADSLIEENYELNLYYGPVSTSYNEYVRYDFYKDAEAHDAAIDSYMKNANTFILKDFFKVEKLGGIHKINFSLRTDEPIKVG